MEDFSPRPEARPAQCRSRVEPFSRLVDSWLREDRSMPRKQRHTAKRVYDRLVAEQRFDGSYSSVRRWMKRWREENRAESDGFVELAWAPGAAQLDFGIAKALIAGVERDVHVLVVSFPYSNMRYCVALPGENAECVCAGLIRVFDAVGRAPGVLVFDNATGVGHRFGRRAAMIRVFNAFQAHYRIGEAGFCNPYSGHGKGSVENAVGFLRRNLMVPMPSAESLEALTRMLLERCRMLARQPHYRKEDTIGALFEQDKARMLALPGVSFDPVRWEIRHADNLGIVTVDGARYLAGAKYHNLPVHVGLRAFDAGDPRHGRRGRRPARAGLRRERRDGRRSRVDPARYGQKTEKLGRKPAARRLPRPGAPGAGRDGRPRTRTTPERPGQVKPDQRVRGHRPGVPRDPRIRARAFIHRRRPDRQAHRPGRRRATRS